MECRDVRPWLATRRDLSWAQEREVQAHLQRCPACTTAWTRGERAIRALRALPHTSAQPPQRVAAALEARLGQGARTRQPFARGVALAGLALCLVLAGVVIPRDLLRRPFAGLSTAGAANGWVAFARHSADPSPGLLERDIYLVREGQAAHRIIGSDSDSLDQICPAFSADGARLAHGEAESTGEAKAGLEGIDFRGAALVISDIDAAGNATESLRIDVGGAFPPPCANWSPDGRMVAFGVPATSPGNPEPSSSAPVVWVVTLEGAKIDVVPNLLATDLEWSPDGSELAIASGQTPRLADGALSLYSVDSGDIRTLVGPSGVSWLSWSPDGTRIAYQRRQSSDNAEYQRCQRTSCKDQEIWVTEADGSAEYLLASGFNSLHGIGPVWSPAGEWIVYLRVCDTDPLIPTGPCHEENEIVLIPTGGELGGRVPGAGEVVLPHLRLPEADESTLWFPYRVTWSPDGTELLSLAWNYHPEGDKALIAVPIGPNAVPVVLYQDSNISTYGGDSVVPIQSWGIRREGQP